MTQGILNLSKKMCTHLLPKALYNGKQNLSKVYFNENLFKMFSSLTSMQTSYISHFFQSKVHKVKNLFLQLQQFPKEQRRTLIKFSLKDGKRLTENIVPEKFFRLNWGIWIRAMAGCDKKLWKKSRSRRNRLQKIVFCNQTQSKMLDTLVSKYWRKPKYYIDDPYAPYHTRENFVNTRKKPWKPEGCDYE